MNILVIGSGGREHALVWKISKSSRVSKIYCAPGNAGIANIAECVPIEADDIETLLYFARANDIHMTIVGPEGPLSMGIVDEFLKYELKIFGPRVKAARIESSKAFAKAFCYRHGIPTAKSKVFENPSLAIDYLRNQTYPLVIKADGLASGKGVVICKTLDEAENTIEDMMIAGRFSDAGKQVIIEEFLDGVEATFIVISDGHNFVPLVSSKDHKPIFDGDRGPNTGGMGAISPATVLTTELEASVIERIIRPAIVGLAAEGSPFAGALYAGLMIKDNKAKVLEFNARFGDPETQPIMMRMKTDIIDIFESAIVGKLGGKEIDWDSRSAACVIMTANGYPNAYEKGKSISGLDNLEIDNDSFVFHSGTKVVNDAVVTNGGRVLGITALGLGLDEAAHKAYSIVDRISFEGAYFRRDIGR